MIKSYCIYKHTNKINGKVYIGQTCQKPEYRWGKDGNGYKMSSRFYSAITCYGWDNFEHEILVENLTKEEADILEQELIEKYKSNNLEFGYNLDSGGKNKEVSEETKQKQSISAQNRPIVSEETKQKLSTVSKGIKRSEETKQKMSEAAKKREKERQGQKYKKVQCINTGEIFDSLRAAADWCGLKGTSGISLVCQNKKQKTAGVHPLTKEKLKWKYV